MRQLLGAKGGGKGGGKGGFDPAMLGMMGANIWDMPMVSSIAFHPSKQKPEHMDSDSDVRDGLFDVSGGDQVSYRLYLPSGIAEVVVYFWHGNAEVCTAVDDMRDVFQGLNAAVLSLDYRGYSWGTGSPSLTKLCEDAEVCFAASLPLLDKAGCGELKRVAMGRSIGATCAVHIAAKRPSKFHGLIVDSGLMSVKGLPMVASMGPAFVGGPDAFAALKEPFDTLGSLAAVSCPLLVMHGRRDEIVPYSQAEECHNRCRGQDKVLKAWDTAGHNDVLMLNKPQWVEAVTELIAKAIAFEEPFPAGVLVEAHSLSAAALNGLKGRVLGPQGERYRVDLGGETGEKALKPANLKVVEEAAASVDDFAIGATVEAHSLSAAELNGLKGTVVGPKGDRVSIKFPDPHGTKALKPANLKLVDD